MVSGLLFSRNFGRSNVTFIKFGSNLTVFFKFYTDIKTSFEWDVFLQSNSLWQKLTNRFNEGVTTNNSITNWNKAS